MAAAFRDVEAATLALDGSPPITRTTFPTCRAHYPGGSSGCACRLLPRSYSLPQMAGGSASALSLSRPAQASLTLRPAGLLNRLKAAFVTRLQPCRLPGRTARQLPDQSTTLWVESSSTSDPRLRGTLPISDVEDANHTDESKRMLPVLISTPISIDKTGHQSWRRFRTIVSPSTLPKLQSAMPW